LIFFVVLNIRISQKRKILENEINRLDKEANDLEQERNKLSAEILKLKDNDFLEKMGRENLNLKKEGEKVIAFPLLEKDSDLFLSTSTNPEYALDKERTNSSPNKNSGFWQKILSAGLKVKQAVSALFKFIRP